MKKEEPEILNSRGSRPLRSPSLWAAMAVRRFYRPTLEQPLMPRPTCVWESHFSVDREDYFSHQSPCDWSTLFREEFSWPRGTFDCQRAVVKWEVNPFRRIT